jgi:Zn-finger nucleic acid-binding protein
MTDRPSKNEEEFFALREAELHRHRHQEAARARDTEERKRHHMRCPRCGAGLATESVGGISFDRCRECRGVFIEAAAAEELIRADRGTMTSIFKSMIRSVSAH